MTNLVLCSLDTAVLNPTLLTTENEQYITSLMYYIKFKFNVSH